MKAQALSLDELEDYIERRFDGWPEEDKQALLRRARTAHEEYTHLKPTKSRLTGDPLPPVNQPGPLDPDTEQVIRIYCPRTGNDQKAHLWAMAQMHHTDRAEAVEWGRNCYERSIKPAAHHIAVIEAELQKCRRAKELMPSFDDHGAQKYLEAALAWWQEGGALDEPRTL